MGLTTQFLGKICFELNFQLLIFANIIALQLIVSDIVSCFYLEFTSLLVIFIICKIAFVEFGSGL